jgi:predicted dehydrogenase
VTAHGQIVYPDRFTVSGEPFTVGAPDFGVALIELADGTLVRLTTSFYVGQQSKQKGIEFHGDTGSLFMSSWQDFDAEVELAPFGGSYEPVPVPGAFHGVDWARALGELADAIAEERPHRAGAAHAAHVVEILDAVETSVREGGTVEVTSSFIAPPAPVAADTSANGAVAGTDIPRKVTPVTR